MNLRSLTRATWTTALVLCLSLPAAADPPAAEREANLALIRADREAVRMLRLLDQSRLSRNVAQITCVDTSLSQINSFSRILELRRDRIRVASAAHDEATVAHEQRIVRRIYGQLRDVAREGRACVYPSAGEDDRTVVEVLIDPAVRHQDLTPPRPPRD